MKRLFNLKFNVPQSFTYLLPAAMLLLILPLNHLMALRLTMLFLAAGAATIYIIREPISPIPLKLPLALWIGAALLSLFWSSDPWFSLNEFKAEIGYGMIAFLTFFSITRAHNVFDRWVNVLLISLGMTFIFAMVAKWHDHLHPMDWHWLHGVGTYSTYLVTIFPFLIFALFRQQSSLSRFLVILMLPLFLLVGFISLNTTFWIATMIMSLVFFTLWRHQKSGAFGVRKFFLALLLIFVAGSALLLTFIKYKYAPNQPVTIENVVLRQAKADDRLDIWRFWLERLKERPLTGVGFGRDAPHYAYLSQIPADRNPVSYAHAHNLFIDYGLQMGIPGIMTLLFLIASISREFWKFFRSGNEELRLIGICGITLVVGVLTKNMTDDFFWRGNSLLFWTLVGISLGYGKSKQREISQ